MKARVFLIPITILWGLSSPAQNSVRLVSKEGEPFTVHINGRAQNKSPEVEVLLDPVLKDTLSIEIRFANGKAFRPVLYLLERSQRTSHKEFDYLVAAGSKGYSLSFTGVYDMTPLPEPLVPPAPIIDTSSKYKNSRLGHFCELKDGKPVYFNNVPENNACTKAMPPEYLAYIKLLMQKAEVADQRYTIAENVCLNNCLSVEQLGVLLAYVDYEIEKLKLVRTAYSHLSDPASQKKIEKFFRFESSILELNNFLKNGSSSDYAAAARQSACSQPSEQAKINELLGRLGVYSNDSQRFEAFKKTSGDYCYSVEQARQVLKTFIHDREKLDAARMMYFNCSDKKNYAAVSEEFSYKQTGSELNDFLEKQKR